MLNGGDYMLLTDLKLRRTHKYLDQYVSYAQVKGYTLEMREINPIHMISTSEIKVSCVIDEEHIREAVQVLHQKFGLDKIE
jgi:aspartokinase